MRAENRLHRSKVVPSFSIIIPAMNEEKHIGKCLDTLAKLDFPKYRYEVILVDNGSTDKTLEIAHSFSTKMRLKILQLPKVNIATLRNRGAQEANNELLAFVDADCTVPEQWLKIASERLLSPGTDITGARTEVPDESSWVAKTWDINTAQTRKTGLINYLPSANMLMKKELFFEVKGFNEQLTTNEDYELCARIREHGYNILSDQRLSVTHWGVPENISQFYRRQLWHGKHVFKVFLNNVRELRNAKAVAYAFYYLISFASLFIGFTMFLLNRSKSLLISSIIILVIPPMILSTKTILKQRADLKYFIPLTTLYFTYGAARANSIFNSLTILRNYTVKHWK